MQVSVEKLNNVQRRLTIVVPAGQVETAYSQQINKIAQTANIKGFRPGKAPVSYIEQRYGEDARKEALSQVIQNALYQAISEQKLMPVSQPRIEPKSVLANAPLEFTATFDVLPEIGDIAFSLESIEKPVVEVKEEDVDRVLDQLTKQQTTWTLVEREAQANDRVVIDYFATLDGKADMENKIQNFPLELGSKLMLPGFEDGLLGATAGSEKTLNLTFPGDFHMPERAGKPVEFAVQVKQVFEAKKPTLDEAFIAKLGIKSGKIEDLRKQIKDSLELERDRLVKDKLKDQVFSKLIEQNNFDVPASLVAREAKNIHDEVYPQHQAHDHHAHTAEETNSFNDIAKKRVALGLLIAEYAKQQNIIADQERVKKRIQEIASAYEDPKEVIEYLSSKERLSNIEAQVLEEQVMDKLMEKTTIAEKQMTYAELKGIRI